MQHRILIYGGTNLGSSLSLFVEELAYALLNHGNFTLVTGGFLHFHDKQEALSTDYSVLCGAKRFARHQKVPLEDCLETWLPDRLKDRRLEGVERFKEGKVVTLFGESDQARRFAMVKHVDIVITVSGKVNTEMVLDFAFTIEKPALPLPFSAGDSLNFWEEKKEKIANIFGIDAAMQKRFESFNPETGTAVERAIFIAEIIACINNALEGNRQDESNEQPGKQPLQLETIGVMKDADDEQMSKANPYQKRPAVFVSYSHKDAKWKEELDQHIYYLKQSNSISYWSDNMLVGGDEWDKKIKNRMESAQIILLLVSPEFVNSKYIQEIELVIAAKHIAKATCKVIPLFITKIDLEHSPIQQLQGYPAGGKTISSLPKSKRANVWFEIVAELKKIIANWNNRVTLNPNSQL